jgi:hypothetical protein
MKVRTFYHSSQHKKVYLRAVPWVFNHVVSIFTSPHTDVMHVDLPRKMKCRWNRFVTGKFHLLQYCPLCSRKIQNVPPCRLVLFVATFSVVKAGEQGVFEEFSTHLSVVYSTRGQPDVLTSLDFADKPAEHDQLFPHSFSVGLNYYPYRCNLCPQIFMPLSDRIRGWRILF